MAFLPWKVQLSFGKAIGWLWFDILRIRRGVALRNLERAMPELSKKQRLQIARRSVENIGMTFIEFLRMFRVKPKDKDLFVIEGERHLKAALAKGKGALLLTQHLGNGDWATAGLALHGLPMHVVTKELKWKPFNEAWFKVRKEMGTQLIGDRNTSYAILKALKKGHPIAFMLDQFMGPPIGVKTKFFGIETGTPMGLAILARRSGAAVVPVYTIRLENGQTVVHFDEEIPFKESEDAEATVQEMTQVYCDKVEEYVRKFPEQWMWVHRRWKVYKH